jgi:hypothetical protein
MWRSVKGSRGWLGGCRCMCSCWLIDIAEQQDTALSKHCVFPTVRTRYQSSQ